MIRKLFALLLSCILLLNVLPVLAESAAEIPVEETIVVNANVADIQKYGNLVLDIPASALLEAGFKYGDLVWVRIGDGDTDEMPLGSNFSDVDQGEPMVRAVLKADAGEDYVLVAINMGDMATSSGIATKEKIEADPGYVWHYNEGIAQPVPVTIALCEQGGYYDQWVIHQLVRSEKREDYPELTDAEFANFRMITTTGIGEGKRYRSASPVNPEINRNKYADAAAKEAGVKTFVNLADNDETMRGYEGFAESYYAGQKIVALNMGVDFSADEFKAGLADGIRFIAANEAPYLVHCNEGKDRAGFTSAMLECLMGATVDEVVADYMVTIYNYYNVKPDEERYSVIANSNIKKSLATAFGVNDITGIDLAAAAEKYLLDIGVSADDIAKVRENLK